MMGILQANLQKLSNATAILITLNYFRTASNVEDSKTRFFKTNSTELSTYSMCYNMQKISEKAILKN